MSACDDTFIVKGADMKRVWAYRFGLGDAHSHTIVVNHGNDLMFVVCPTVLLRC